MENNNKEPKKFYRSRNKVIAGVCQGLADYLNMDVGLVRAVAVVSLFFGGFGFWAYLVFMIATPLEPAHTRR